MISPSSPAGASTAGLRGSVRDSTATGPSSAARPSSRYPGLKATCIGSPSYPASIASLARASSLPPASTTRPSSPNDSRTGVVRSATSATRRTTSTSAATCSRACASWWSGSRLRTFGKSPSSSRLVVRRGPPTNPIMPSPIPPRASATVTSPPSGPSVLAVSARILAGTSACRLASGTSGRHCDLGHRGGEPGRVDGTGGGRHLRQRRVVLDRHRRQGEPGTAADQLQVRPDRGHVDRLGGQRLGDLGEQPAGDQRGTVGVALHVGTDLAGHLVVEAGYGQPPTGHP